MGLEFPGPLGLAAGLRQERRRHRRAGRAGVRVRRGRHGHRASRSRATRSRGCSGCPRTGRSSTGWASTTTAPRPSPTAAPRRGSTAATAAAGRIGSVRARRCSGSTSARPRWSPRTTSRPCSPTTRSAPACSRRTPTTSWSTSPRPNTPGLRSLQAVERLAPLLDEVRRVADEAAGRRRAAAASRSPPTSPTRTWSPSPSWPVSHGLDGIIATNTTISREGLRTDAAEVAALGAGGLSGPGRCAALPGGAAAPAGPRPADRVISVGGITSADDAPRPARRRRRPAPGLHRRSSTGDPVAAPDRVAGPLTRQESPR